MACKKKKKEIGENMITADKFSFNGYNIVTWLTKNKDTLKVIFLGTASVLGIVLQKDNLSTTRIALTGVGVAVCKLAVDALDYFITENPK